MKFSDRMIHTACIIFDTADELGYKAGAAYSYNHRSVAYVTFSGKGIPPTVVNILDSDETIAEVIHFHITYHHDRKVVRL